MACQCGTNTEARADETGVATCGCGSGSAVTEAGACGCGSGAPEGQEAGSPENLDVATLARLVKELDQRVRELETSRG